MTTFKKHPEITCPYCRVGFGTLKSTSKDKFQHLDLFWSYESGLIVDCENNDVLALNLEKMDDKGNPKFKTEFEEKLKELQEENSKKPDDICKDTCSWDSFQTLFVNAINWGSIDEEDEEYDRESMKWEDIELMYNENKNLYEILRHYIVKAKE